MTAPCQQAALAAGLARALADHPDDVEAAFASATQASAALNVPTDPAAEPWPPMRPAP